MTAVVLSHSGGVHLEHFYNVMNSVSSENGSHSHVYMVVRRTLGKNQLKMPSSHVVNYSDLCPVSLTSHLRSRVPASSFNLSSACRTPTILEWQRDEAWRNSKQDSVKLRCWMWCEARWRMMRIDHIKLAV